MHKASLVLRLFRYNEKTDVYSFGVMLFEVFSRSMLLMVVTAASASAEAAAAAAGV